jgi:hypothetical protein
VRLRTAYLPSFAPFDTPVSQDCNLNMSASRHDAFMIKNKTEIMIAIKLWTFNDRKTLQAFRTHLSIILDGFAEL